MVHRSLQLGHPERDRQICRKAIAGYGGVAADPTRRRQVFNGGVFAVEPQAPGDGPMESRAIDLLNHQLFGGELDSLGRFVTDAHMMARSVGHHPVGQLVRIAMWIRRGQRPVGTEKTPGHLIFRTPESLSFCGNGRQAPDGLQRLPKPCQRLHHLPPHFCRRILVGLTSFRWVCCRRRACIGRRSTAEQPDFAACASR